MRFAKTRLVAFAAAMLTVSSALAGNLTPPGAPAGTMMTLEEVGTQAASAELAAAAAESAATGAASNASNAEAAASNAASIAGDAETAALAAESAAQAAEAAANAAKTAAEAAEAAALSSSGDARTAITSVPFEINASGSYYFTQNLTMLATNENAILIQASDVSIDLNGFALIGPGSGAGGFEDGISALGQNNIEVRNGTVRDFTDRGIFLSSGSNMLVHDMRVWDNGGDGIFIGLNGVIRDCSVRENGGIGIRVGSGAVITNCSSRQNGGIGLSAQSGSLIESSTSINNGGDGITAGNCLIRGNVSLSNVGSPITAGGATLVDNHAP